MVVRYVALRLAVLHRSCIERRGVDLRVFVLDVDDGGSLPVPFLVGHHFPRQLRDEGGIDEGLPAALPPLLAIPEHLALLVGAEVAHIDVVDLRDLSVAVAYHLEGEAAVDLVVAGYLADGLHRALFGVKLYSRIIVDYHAVAGDEVDVAVDDRAQCRDGVVQLQQVVGVGVARAPFHDVAPAEVGLLRRRDRFLEIRVKGGEGHHYLLVTHILLRCSSFRIASHPRVWRPRGPRPSLSRRRRWYRPG